MIFFMEEAKDVDQRNLSTSVVFGRLRRPSYWPDNFLDMEFLV